MNVEELAIVNEMQATDAEYIMYLEMKVEMLKDEIFECHEYNVKLIQRWAEGDKELPSR